MITSSFGKILLSSPFIRPKKIFLLSSTLRYKAVSVPATSKDWQRCKVAAFNFFLAAAAASSRSRSCCL